MTPIDLVPGAVDETHPHVTNILRFVQTLDADNDLSNGIQITVEVSNLAAGRTIDFNLSIQAFENDGNVQAVLADLTSRLGQPRGLISATAAQAHLRSSLGRGGVSPPEFNLSVQLVGSGSGSVSTVSAGILCGVDCSEVYDSGTVVSLKATPFSGSTFTGWSGACSGTETCTFTVDGAMSAMATFEHISPEKLTRIAAGQKHTCTALTSGTVRCWGKNQYGQLGHEASPHSSVPIEVPGINTAISVSAGIGHSCALLTDGTVRCWGENSSGQLGHGTSGLYSSSPVPVIGVSTATAISAGGRHTCAVLIDGLVKCWGANWIGQLGDGTKVNSMMPVKVTGVTNATAVASGDSHACAIRSDGTARCWGRNLFGALGDGSEVDASTSVEVVNLDNATSIAAGWNHTCAGLFDSSVRCWGGGYANTPVAVSGVHSATTVAVGLYYSCALLSDGTVRCWGYNYFGQLGNGTASSSPVPDEVTGINSAVGVSAGNDFSASGHSCALLFDGAVKCWGRNDFGQLGNGVEVDASLPVAVVGINSGISVSAGGGHTCAILGDGRVQCWGGNLSGQLGDGSNASSFMPVEVAGITIATAIATSGHDVSGHSCALLADGTVFCWGSGYWSEIGKGTLISGITSAIAITAGEAAGYNCALIADGTIRCWGPNISGQPGDGTWTNSVLPVEISGITSATAISTRGDHTCALLSGGTVECWGGNTYGELGDGTVVNSTMPVEVSGITSATAISSGGDHTCALLSDGTIRCWGKNWQGQLGNGTFETSPLPVTVTGIATATAIAAGGGTPARLL